MASLTWYGLGAAGAVVWLVACSPAPGDATSPDASSSVDAGPDGPTSAPDGSPPDAGDAVAPPPDAGAEASHDAGADASLEAGTDANIDATGEAGTGEASVESGAADGGGPGDAGPTYLCGSQALLAPPDAGTGVILPSLGLQSAVSSVQRAGDLVAATGQVTSFGVGGWALWNTQTRLQIASGPGVVVGLTGAYVAVLSPTTLALDSTADGSALASVPLAGATQAGVAEDGSYVWTASASALSLTSPKGAPLVTHAGNYAGAAVYAAKGRVLVARGPAGANVIETVDAASGAATTSPSFSGTFASWFTDGTGFLSSVGTTNAYVYSPAATQLQLLTVPAVGVLGGGGKYVWAGTSLGSVDVYALGAAAPVATLGPSGTAIGTPRTLAFLASSGATLTLVDLQSTTFARQDVTTAVSNLGGFGADAAGLWAVGAQGVVAFHGTTSSPDATGTLGCGQVLSLAGSAAGAVALGTPVGTLLLDVPGASAEASFAAPAVTSADALRLSSDGHTLAIASDVHDATAHRGVDVYAWPGWGPASSLPYTLGSGGVADIASFDLSRQGNAVALSLAQANAGADSYETTLTALPAGTRLLDVTASASLGDSLRPLLSPGGATVAVTDRRRSASSSTQLYQGGKLVGAASGVAVGWIDDGHLVVDTYTGGVPLGSGTFAGTTIVDGVGQTVASPPLPEIPGFDVIDATRIFSHGDQAIYDWTTGARLQSTGLPAQSAVAGPFIVSVSGQRLQAT